MMATCYFLRTLREKNKTRTKNPTRYRDDNVGSKYYCLLQNDQKARQKKKVIQKDTTLSARKGCCRGQRDKK